MPQKRKHEDSDSDSDSSHKRPKIVETEENPKSDAVKQLETLSNILGINDNLNEDTTDTIWNVPFADPEEVSELSEQQRADFVELATSVSSRITTLIAEASKLQGNTISLRDLQVNWNLPPERRFAELGLWKSIQMNTSNTISKVASEVKRFKRKQQFEAKPKKSEVADVTLYEIFQAATNSKSLAADSNTEASGDVQAISNMISDTITTIQNGKNPFVKS